MLQKSQIGYFNEEGENVGKQLEEWIEKMDDYYDLAHSSEENRAMMGRFKLEKLAKLRWQDHCKENNLKAADVSWDYLQTQLQRNYQNCTYRIKRLNKFLDYSQGKDNLKTHYQRFLKLLKYAPQDMTQEVKVARFVSKLNSPLNTRLQALWLTTFIDVLDAGQPIEQEVNNPRTQNWENVPQDKRRREAEQSLQPNPQEQFTRLPPYLNDQARQDNLCLVCLEPGHQDKNCPFSQRTPNQPPQ